MIPGFNPQASNIKGKNQNFCAIVPKHYDKAKEAVRIKSGYLYPVRDTQEAFMFNNISKQDASDTLDAIKGIYPERFHHVVDTAKKWMEDFPRK